jgi:murein DD-endopeptidase MepM/ murein hydrolase activator NlpD
LNIIWVGGPRSRCRSIDLKCRRVRWLAGLSAGLLTIAILGMGVLIGRQFGGPGSGPSIAELEALRQQLLEQQAQIDDTESRARHEIDALAIQIGDLMAQAARLNALGQRLTRMGKLEEGEFDFSTAPGVGGPEPQRPVEGHFLSAEFTASLDTLRSQFEQQAEQLGVLETLILDRDLEATFMPAGMPVRTGFMSSSFGTRIDPFTGKPDFHAGIDFNGPRGSDILSVASGVVVFAGRHPAYGNLIEIDHGNGYSTRYAHNDRNLVKVGDVIQGGQLIAKMGSTGRTTGSHLHFEVWQDGKPVNPRKFVSAMR